MMKRYLFLLAILFTAGRALAQCDSTFFRYTGTMVLDMSILDTSKMIAVGDNGDIIKTIDGGKTWRNITTYNPFLLSTIQFASDSVGYTAGSWKTILKTEDQGESWFPLYADIPPGSTYTSSYFTDMHFFNKDHGFIVGQQGLFIVTDNGGKTFSNASLQISDDLYSITFLTDSIGFVCGSGSSLYKTINGGRTWQKITPAYGGSYKKIKFINSTTGFMIGNSGQCLKTTDGGNTWSNINTPTTGEYNDIFFLTPLKGFIVGTYVGGLILQTTDGGNTWNTDYNYPVSYSSYYCINADAGKKKLVIAGGGMFSEFQGYNGRNILATTDGGASYSSLSRNGRMQLSDVYFLNESTGYISGEQGTVLKTKDYGESWKPLTLVPANSDYQARKVFFIDSVYGYAATDNIYKTTNGGNSWTIVTSPTGNTQYTTTFLHAFDKLNVLMSDNGRIYKTVDGGNSWTVPEGSRSYYDVTVAPGGKSFAVGYNGFADVSADQGETWLPFNLQTDKELTAVYFYDSNLGFIGTYDSTIFKTSDGGNNWTRINIKAFQYTGLRITSFHFTDPLNGRLMCNNNGGISWLYKTKDGGITWDFEREEHENLSKFSNAKTLYTVGGNGMILKTEKLQQPNIPGYIYGPAKGCGGSQTSYVTGNLTGVNFNWILSDGGISTSARNRDTILWNSTGSYTLSVTASNACGTSPARVINIDAFDYKPVITVKDSVFTVSEGLAYQWLVNSYPNTAFDSSLRSFKPFTTATYSAKVKTASGCTYETPPLFYVVPVMLSICPGSSTTIPYAFSGTTYQWQRDDGNGFVNISDNSFYSGTATASLQLTNIPSSWYGYQFKLVTDYGSSQIYRLAFTDRWTGSAGTAWEDIANWSCGKLPDANTDVIITSGTVVISSNTTIRKLKLEPGVQLTVQPGFTLTITH